MKRLTFIIFSIFLIGCLIIPGLEFKVSAQIPDGYYSGTENLTGQGLKTKLHNIIKDHKIFPYTSSSSTDTWDILKQSDKDTINPENIILFYTGWTVNAAQEYNNGKGYDREHVWALSHGIDLWGDSIGVSDERTEPGTDVHHIKPSDISVNGRRYNKDFDNGGTIVTDKDGMTECKDDNDSWEPRDRDKGDVARILFYMAVRYEGTENEPDLELVDQVNSDKLDKPGKGYHGKLCTLCEWHKLDPPDKFERNRNDVIYSYQKNRNPFIDHPEFVEKIWCPCGLGISTLEQSFKVYPNPTKGKLTIEMPGNSRTTGRLMNMNGEILREFEFVGKTEIGIEDISSGMYLLKIVSEGNEYCSKVLVEK